MTVPSRIAHVIYRLDYGGLENGVVNLVNRMPAERYRHAIVCLAGYGVEFAKRICQADVEIVSLDKRPGKDIGVYRRMWREIRRLRPAIVHTRNLGTIDMQWVAAAAGVHHRVHGEHGWEASDPQGRQRRSLRIRRACRPLIQRYVPVSQDIAGWLERDIGVAPDRIRQIYNGVDTAKFHPSPAMPGEGALVIGTVGRLDPVKNQASLLHAARRVLDQRPDLDSKLRVMIAGDGPLRANLESLAQELGLKDRVWFLGARSDVPDIMRSIHVFALPSLSEGVSNTILEAMATGLPVVAARVGGNPEIVVEGVTGTLYDAGDAGGLTAALLAYVEDPVLRLRHGNAGRERVARNFSLDAMVQRYLGLYDELLTPSLISVERGLE